VAGAVVLVTSHVLIAVVIAQAAVQLALAVASIHAGRLLHDAVPSPIRAGVSSGAGTLSWVLFLPLALGFGALSHRHGVYAAGWVITGAAAALAVLLIVANRSTRPATDPVLSPELDCRDLVQVVSAYLDGELAPTWRAAVEDHLTVCDGCTTYADQIRQTVDLLSLILASEDELAPAIPTS
jgi:hypothetical protein